MVAPVFRDLRVSTLFDRVFTGRGVMTRVGRGGPKVMACWSMTWRGKESERFRLKNDSRPLILVPVPEEKPDDMDGLVLREGCVFWGYTLGVMVWVDVFLLMREGEDRRREWERDDLSLFSSRERWWRGR